MRQRAFLSVFHSAIQKYLRINERIRARTVRLIDENANQVGIVAVEKALELAKLAELDLVEVTANLNPPVCKIMDYGKFLYQQSKKDQQKKKAQKQAEVKGVRLGMRTDTNDMETKANHAREFLKEKNLVKVAMTLRGREFAHMDMARDKLFEFAAMLKDIGSITQEPKKTGNTFTLVLAPLKKVP